MVSRKRERKRWRTETKLPCNTIYISRACVCVRASSTVRTRKRDALAFLETLNTHRVKQRKNHRVKAAEERHQESARSNGQGVL